MASRQTTSTTSSSGYSYAAPGTYANAQVDFDVSLVAPPQVANTGVTGFGASNTIQSVTLPINLIVGNGSTATVTTGSQLPSWLTSGTTVVIGGSAGAFAGTYTLSATPVLNSYSFQFSSSVNATVGSLSGGNMTGVFSGTTASGTSPALQAYAPALNGTTIRGSSCGPCEIWADGAIWDTTNSRYLSPGIDFQNVGMP